MSTADSQRHGTSVVMDASYSRIMRLAFPLIVTMSGFMLMYFVDALFLSWYSAESIAAVVPASMASHMLMVLFAGTASYTSVLVSQYVGAGRPQRVAATVWQGIYVSVGSGALVAVLSALSSPLFAMVGHGAAVQALEARYFRIVCLGAVFTISVHALAGFFTGRGDTRTLMYVHAGGFAVNGFLDYALVFGKFGFPELGIGGAATATVAGQCFVAAVLLLVFASGKNRSVYDSWGNCRFDFGLMWRLVRFGVPNGSRFAVEMFAWTIFVFFVGRIGMSELAATSIAWRINGIAFFPLIGLSSAVAILVGNAQGARRPDVSSRVTRRGLLLGEVWMVGAAAIFVLLPRQLYALFYSPTAMSEAEFQALSSLGVVLLRFVAVYSLLDGFNMIILGTLQAAGDTRWTLITSVAAHALFLSVLIVADMQATGLMVEWGIATGFVVAQAALWFCRFHSGKWRAIEVIEAAEDGTRSGDGD